MPVNIASELKKSTIAGVWFVFLTFPLMVIKVDTINNTIEWRWMNMLWVGVGAFFLSMLWRFMLYRRELGQNAPEAAPG